MATSVHTSDACLPFHAEKTHSRARFELNGRDVLVYPFAIAAVSALAGAIGLSKNQTDSASYALLGTSLLFFAVFVATAVRISTLRPRNCLRPI